MTSLDSNSSSSSSESPSRFSPAKPPSHALCYQECLNQKARTLEGWRYFCASLPLAGLAAMVLPSSIPAKQRLVVLGSIGVVGMGVDHMRMQRICVKETARPLPPLPSRKPAQ
mmetsp:Transcript_12925/g.31680  ORF Transcript_12925/g.31680 Transcript_12925/m.31680 type:complete len:113 (-) Transcript_12925:361-699(-)|eukprot:CAMPEP_0114512116 /NCGR_PEP_ID=MMETSP0109-20121206/14788_1 /TAXON_ID=29199 /ORGANISM="Chlorarachnion reptans, Strain CCCM449" /LENGTH=112 /DNA_ID=CAMNT_0001691747 /DNA_START=124 /DNA_END=462 /DNA_ORIENTATION=+